MLCNAVQSVYCRAMQLKYCAIQLNSLLRNVKQYYAMVKLTAKTKRLKILNICSSFFVWRTLRCDF